MLPLFAPLLIPPILHPSFSSSGPDTVFGNHGFDNMEDDMGAFFLASGPAILHNATQPASIDNIDVYSLLSWILNMQPAPTNGSLSIVYPYLNEEYFK